jgi:hypothetical protein
MAQSDQVVQNATFPSVRADINDNLAALYSQSSGNSAPTVTVAFQPWIDTSSSPPTWKVRNGSNSAWITIGILDPAQFQVNGLISGVNAIINGNPIINQRGYASGTATTTANQYTLDRWKVVTSGQSITWTDSGNVRTVTAPAGGVEQVIEGINLITGTYTLNWTGTASATIAGTSVAKGGNVSITGGTDTTVRFSSGTFSLVQFESGTAVTPFERRSYGQELALCQRYFETSYPPGVAPGTATSATGWGGISLNAGDLYNSYTPTSFHVKKRASPTMIGYAGSNGVQGQLYNVSLAANQGNIGFRFVSDCGYTMYCSNNAMTAANAFAANYSADAEL